MNRYYNNGCIMLHVLYVMWLYYVCCFCLLKLSNAVDNAAVVVVVVVYLIIYILFFCCFCQHYVVMHGCLHFMLVIVIVLKVSFQQTTTAIKRDKIEKEKKITLPVRNHVWSGVVW